MRFPVGNLCARVGMSRQNYYRGHRQRQRRKVDADLVEQLVRTERAVQPRLGGRKLHYLCGPHLEAAGVRIGRDRFFAVLAEKSLLLEPLPRKPRTTDSRHVLPVFANQVKDLALTAPNQAWAGDITYIRTASGWVYLAVVIELYSRKVIGWAMAGHMQASLVCDALRMALSSRQPLPGVLMHTDRGSQYASQDHRELLQAHALVQSMSRKGNCWDNAVTERFFLNLKMERVWQQQYANLVEAQQDVTDYIVNFYNAQRLHSALGYRTPNEFEAMASDNTL